MGVSETNRGLDRPFRVPVVLHVEGDRGLDLRRARNDPFDQVEGVAAVDVESELRELDADVRRESLPGDPVERRDIYAGCRFGLLEVRDVLTEVVRARRCTFRVDRADSVNGVLDVFSGDEPKRNFSAKAPGRQAPHEGAIDYAQYHVAQHDQIVGARAEREEEDEYIGPEVSYRWSASHLAAFRDPPSDSPGPKCPEQPPRTVLVSLW